MLGLAPTSSRIAIAASIVFIGGATGSVLAQGDTKDDAARDSAASAPADTSLPALDCSPHQVQGPQGEPQKELDRRAKRKIKKLIKKANRRCERRQYDACISRLREAYAIDGARAHLRALADAYKEAQRTEPALCLERQLLTDAPDAERANLEQRIAVLQALRQAQHTERQALESTLGEVREAVTCESHTWAGPAAAPTGRAARKAKRAAKKRIKKARSHCRAKRHGACVKAWQAAYAIDGKRAHVLAAVPAYRAQEQYEAAICAYQQYIESAPAGIDSSAEATAMVATYREFVPIREERARVNKEITSAVTTIGCADKRLPGPDKAVTERAQAKALAEVKSAQELCLAQQVKECADALQRAYQLDGNEVHLLSIAFQYGQMREYEQAICIYDQFLAADPPEQYVTGTRAKLLSMSEDYNKARATEAELAQTKEIADKTQNELKKTAEDLEREAQAREQAAKEAEQKTEKLKETEEALKTTSTWIKESGRSTAGTTQRYIGLGLLGGGALSVGIGVLSALDARSTENSIEQTAVWGDEFDQMIDDGKAARSRAIIFSAAGGAALIGGALLYWLGERASKNVEVDVSLPEGQTGRTFIRLRGQF